MFVPFSAVLLAAGRSTRMGRDKALLEVEGAPLWQRQRDVLAQAGAAEILLSARPDQPWTRGIAGFGAVVHDATPSCGPLSGLVAGLERAMHPHVAVLAIDLPQVRAEWFRDLLNECGPAVGVVGRRGEFFEPLAAIYPRELLPLAWQALVRRELSLQALIQRAVGEGLLRARGISPEASAQFANWNEPAAQ